ncbi:MAG TPA: DMT family transporter [Candidatus Polarisedimenticolaceae bacterium]|nr:DMT family transporter [Candidatus Polarisedimenticolaceae bacterium]
MPPVRSAESARQRALVTGALILVQVFFGLHYLAAKVVLREIPPRAWAVLRVAAAAVLLLALARLLGRRLPSAPRDLLRLAVFSVFGVTLNQVLFVEGLARTTPTHSSLINTTIPIGTLICAALLGRERPSWAKAAALAVASGGVWLVIHRGQGPDATGVLVGDLLTLINALSYSFFLVITKRLLSRVDALGATAVLLAFGAVGIALIGLPALAHTDLRTVSATAWTLGGFIVVFPTAGAYLLQYWALARVESSVVAFFVYLQPLIAAALSFALLHERPAPRVLAGGLLIFGGVYLALRRPGDRRGPASC